MAHAWERQEILVQRPDTAMQEFLLETGDSCIGGPRMASVVLEEWFSHVGL